MSVINLNSCQNTKSPHFCTGKDCELLRDNLGILCRGQVLSPLCSMSKALVESDNLNKTLGLVLKILKENLGINKAFINLFNRKTGKIFIFDSIGLTENEKARGVYSLGEGITGKVVESGQAIIVPRISQEANFLNKTRSHSAPEAQDSAFICIPILRGKKVLGTLSVERICEDPGLLSYDVELLDIIAALIAQAVELYLLEKEERPLWQHENERLQNALKEKFHPSNLLGHSKPMLEVYALIEKVAKIKTTVLLLGESGVGKELVANAIHYNSLESKGPFIKFNCAALPESIIESELFGHEKGAFTGADAQRKGRFEEADKGSIFLDEVGELSLGLQAKLLRVLQERSFERLGGNKTLQVDIRILAATNKDLGAMVKAGTFREDLYYRLNVFPLLIPPLRKRGSDIITLADHFTGLFSERFGKEVKCLSTEAQEMLLAYSWPGNVRELENCLARAVILSDDPLIHPYHLPLVLQSEYAASRKQEHQGLQDKLEAFEYEMIIEALLLHKGNINAVAQDLGLTRRVLGLRLEKFDLNFRKFKPCGAPDNEEDESF